MNITDVYAKIKKLDQDVKTDLIRQGIVPPIKNKDGSISVGYFKIIKERTGFYEIVDFSGETVVEQINLPQSAALLANKLALGKYIDDNILTTDRNYGHAMFEETLQTQLANKKLIKKDFDSADLLFTKAKISKVKKDRYKKEIISRFEKLIRFR